VEQIAQGAEATVHRDSDHIIKRRPRKSYRHPRLDERLRSERTRDEARILSKLSCTPSVIERDEHTITCEYVDGPLLSDVIADKTDVLEAVGDALTAVHDNHIYHGDLTTSNIIIADEPVLIDFGLGGYSDRVEDKAVDIYLLRKAVISKHQSVTEQAWTAFLDGYQPADREAILDQYETVKQRGRYK
jgi:Kae1-associated kinase Bud32